MRKSLMSSLLAVLALLACAGLSYASPSESGQAASSVTAETKPAAEPEAPVKADKAISPSSSQATAPAVREKSTAKRRTRNSSRQTVAANATPPAPAAASTVEPPVQAAEEPAPAAAPAEVYPPTLTTPAATQSAPPPSPAPAVVQTAVTPAAPAPVAQEIPSMASDFPIARILGAFGIVLSLIGAAVFGTRRFAPQLFRKAVPEKSLRIIETLQMGDKRSLSVVQIEDKRFLIGSTSSQITLLAPLRGRLSIEDEPAAKAPAEPAAQPRPRASVEKFRNIFEIEKTSPARNGGRTKTIPPDVRAKMRQLRESLEQ